MSSIPKECPRFPSNCPRILSNCPRFLSNCPRFPSNCLRFRSNCPRFPSNCPRFPSNVLDSRATVFDSQATVLDSQATVFDSQAMPSIPKQLSLDSAESLHPSFARQPLKKPAHLLATVCRPFAAINPRAARSENLGVASGNTETSEATDPPTPARGSAARAK